MNKRMLGVVTAGVLGLGLMVAPAALAHGDSHPDAAGSTCDTWSRDGHTHDHTSSNDTDLGVAYLHNHGGHYQLRGDSGHLEIIGGQGYNQGGNQGGVVQGEFDNSAVPVDADASVYSFAGSNAPYGTAGACVSVADMKFAV